MFVWRRRRRRRRGGRICNSGIDSIPEVTSGIGGTGRREGREKHRRHSGRNGCVYPSAGSGRRRGGGWGERGRRCGILLPLADNFFSTETETGKQERKLTHRQKNDHHSPPLLLLTEKIIKKNSNSFKDNYIQTQGKFRPRKLTISFHYLYFFCWFFVGFFFFLDNRFKFYLNFFCGFFSDFFVCLFFCFCFFLNFSCFLLEISSVTIPEFRNSGIPAMISIQFNLLLLFCFFLNNFL